MDKIYVIIIYEKINANLTEQQLENKRQRQKQYYNRIKS